MTPDTVGYRGAMMNLHLWPFVVVVACWAIAVLILVDVIRISV